jgi:hypothetical protein
MAKITNTSQTSIDRGQFGKLAVDLVGRLHTATTNGKKIVRRIKSTGQNIINEYGIFIIAFMLLSLACYLYWGAITGKFLSEEERQWINRTPAYTKRIVFLFMACKISHLAHRVHRRIKTIRAQRRGGNK